LRYTFLNNFWSETEKIIEIYCWYNVVHYVNGNNLNMPYFA